MTKQERMKAFEMRLDGSSWLEIADVLGYTATTVQCDLRSCLSAAPRQVNCVYPALRRVITERYGGSVRTFASACGLSTNSLYAVLPGRSRPSVNMINAILKETGLCYEEAFRTEES